jgi:hypothetical protein
MLNNLTRIWASISKPSGLEDSKIENYFDIAFAPLPHKLLQPTEFENEVNKLAARFREGYKDRKTSDLTDDGNQALLLPEYHRRIPVDGFPAYAQGIWEQIMSNKDLDLPTQQELLAQFRCGEIARECMLAFDEVIVPLENEQADAKLDGKPSLLADLGMKITTARHIALQAFETEASRYHKGVFKRQLAELTESLDSRLKLLYQRQLDAASRTGLATFVGKVIDVVKAGPKAGTQLDFATIVETEKKSALEKFEQVAKSSAVDGTTWSVYTTQLAIFKKDLDNESKRLRQEEMRRLSTRVEKWIKSRLDESIGLEFNKLGSGSGGSRAPASGTRAPSEDDHWDRIWNVFTEKVSEADNRFTERAKSLDASADEAEFGLWRLRRLAWASLKAKINEESAEGNLGMKLRENFEDRFKYDDEGVPRIWRPSDDIDGHFSKARDQTLKLIPMLSRFHLSTTSAPPPLDAWIGSRPESAARPDDEELEPIGGVDDTDSSLEEEMLILSDARQADVTARFRKIADGVYVEAKRGALGGMTQVPLWMWGLLLVLGQNEVFAVARNPFLILLLLLTGAGLYITYQLNLWGPIIRMTTAAWEQGLEVGKERLREILVNSETGRQAIAMEGRGASAKPARKQEEPIQMERLNNEGKRSGGKGDQLWD